MFKVTILSVGKIKEKHYQAAILEYAKRLAPFGKIDFFEVPSESFKSESQKQKAKQKEGERILAFISRFPHHRTIRLSENGRQFSSVEFADFLNKINQPIIFVISGALGFSEEVEKQIPEKISLSPMTFPHELAQVVLLEQIYRAITIIKNKTYHY